MNDQLTVKKLLKDTLNRLKRAQELINLNSVIHNLGRGGMNPVENFIASHIEKKKHCLNKLWIHYENSTSLAISNSPYSSKGSIRAGNHLVILLLLPKQRRMRFEPIKCRLFC